MNSYYIVFGVILALAIIDYVCLLWVMRLQKQVRHLQTAKPKEEPAMKPSLSSEQLAGLNAALAKETETAIHKASLDFQDQLKTTLTHVGQSVGDLSDKVIQDELTKYQNALEEVRQASVDTLSEVQQVIDKRRAEMEEALATEVAEEKGRILERFDKQMGEIVSAYLIEALGSGVDLGAQSQYVLTTLEEHKEDIKKALLS